MGTNRCNGYGKGSSVDEAYARVQKSDDDEYGHQEGYSGHLNNVCGVDDLTERYRKSGMGQDEFITNFLDEGQKGDPAGAICAQKPIGNNNKTKSQVEHIVTHGTKKWVTYYCVYTDNFMDNKFLGKKQLKADAVKIGRKHSADTKEPTVVKLEKHLEGVEPEVATITYKPAKNEREGAWHFFGLASD